MARTNISTVKQKQHVRSDRPMRNVSRFIQQRFNNFDQFYKYAVY